MGVVYLVRHGQASFGAENYDQLSEMGFEQARLLGTALRERLPRVDAVVTGTLARHQQTAQTCLAALGCETASVQAAGFDEFDHEDIVARHTPRYADQAVLREELSRMESPRQAYQALYLEAVARWVSGQHDADYPEPWSTFRQRCVTALDALIEQMGPSKNALVFTSGGPITAVCQDLLRIPDEHAFRLNLTLANCGLTKVIYSARGRYLSTLNEHVHFEGAQRALLTYR